MSKNEAEAINLFQKAAEQGMVEAENMLGNIYFSGQGVPQNDTEAVNWYRRAAEKGFAASQFNLGVMYAQGKGVAQDEKEAIKWFQQSAKQGYTKAKDVLAAIKKNKELAHQENIRIQQADELRKREIEKSERRSIANQTNSYLSNNEYTGDLMSVNFDDIEIRAILRIIADFSGVNIVVSDSVRGKITLHIQNIPWDQVLDIILIQKGLAMRPLNNAIYIAPIAEIAAQDALRGIR